MTHSGVSVIEPDAHIPGDRRRALAAGVELPDHVEGAALFADISGFTRLTDLLDLELGPQRGAEHITAHLDRVFGALISTLSRHGGEVIYFSGDAITCWIDGDDGLQATACGLAMQNVMHTHGEVVTPAGTRIALAMKVAVAVGAARRFVVGDPRIQRIDVLAGRLVDVLANVEHCARAGEVLLETSALARLAGAVDVAEMRDDPLTGTRVAMVAASTPVPAPPPASIAAPALPADVVRQWLLPAIYDRVAAHRGEFLSELRPAYPMFIRFGGIDYDRDPDAIGKLDRFIRRVQGIVTALGGNCLHLTLGDKGAYLYAVFGAPIAHEDDAARVATAALRVRELPAITDVVDVQIGLTYGRVHSSTYGHPQRQVYTCFGDAVNTAARLMMAAPPGAIYAAEALPKATGTVFDWTPLPPVVVKGKAAPITVFALANSIEPRHAVPESKALPLIGRRAELAVLATRLDQALEAHGQMISVTAEAGMGKSRLLAELVRLASSRGLFVASGECQPFGTSTAYFAWRPIWQALLDVDANAAPVEQIDSLTKRLAAIDSALLPRLPLLGALVGVPVPGNALTESLDAQFRKASLEDLLVVCWRALARAAPRVVIVEDAHWIDELSRDLLDVIAKSSVDLPVLIATASRPHGAADPVARQLASLTNYTGLALTELDAGDVVELARAKVTQMTAGSAVASTELVEMVTRRANGNPFYVEELLNFIASRGIGLRDDRAWKELDLPDNLHSVILGRIDAVDEEPRRTLKVASVIGRTFAAPALPGAYPELGTQDDVARQLTTLTNADLIFSESAVDQTYVFKHSLTQEVAYESLPFGFRSVLHERVAAYIERSHPDALDRHLDLLAHHYWHTANLPKKREYLRRAGMAAQAAYANTSAIDYYERLAGLAEGVGRVDALLKLGAVLDLTGDWRRAEEVDRDALSLAAGREDRVAEGWCETALAEVVRKQGQYERALDHLARAEGAFDEARERAGLGRVLHLRGTLAGQRGDFETAEENFRASLAIREALDDKANMANVLSNLGVIAEYRGNYPESSAFHERAMALRTALGDRRGIAVSMTNIGTVAVLEQRFADARRWFEQFNVLAREVGDAWMIGNGENNLGNALRGLGDYAAARTHYATSLRRFAQLEDPWALAYLAEDVALLEALTDVRVAYRLLGGADSLRDTIGSPRPPTRESELTRALASAGPALPDGERERCREAGRRLDLPALIELAGQLCDK